MAAFAIKCRDMPNMHATRITLWLVSPQNPWHPPLHPFVKYEREAGYYGVTAISDIIWTADGPQAPKIPASSTSRNPMLLGVSSTSPIASGSPLTP